MFDKHRKQIIDTLTMVFYCAIVAICATYWHDQTIAVVLFLMLYGIK